MTRTHTEFISPPPIILCLPMPSWFLIRPQMQTLL